MITPVAKVIAATARRRVRSGSEGTRRACAPEGRRAAEALISADVGHVPVAGLPGPPVAQPDAATREAVGGDELEPGWDGALGEQPLAGAEQHRVEDQLEPVDEIVPQQRLDEVRAA